MQRTPYTPVASGDGRSGSPYNDGATLQSLVATLVTRGDKPCIISLAGAEIEQWSYSRVAGDVARLAAGLVRAGIGRGDHVVLLAKNRPEWYIAAFATLAAGAVAVPLDTSISNEALGHTLRDSDARLIFTTTDYVNRLTRLDLPTPPRQVFFDTTPDDARGWRALQGAPEVTLPVVTPADPAVLFYTSGTTGVPKGVPLSHRNLAFQVDALLHSGLVTAADSALQPLPMYHVYPFMVGLLIMALGTTVVLPGGLTGPQLIRALQAGNPTVITGVPRLYRALYTGLEARATGSLLGPLFRWEIQLSSWLNGKFGWRAGKLLLSPIRKRMGPALRLMVSGGSALDAALGQQLEALGWDVASGYGLSETSPLLALNLPGSRKPGSAGRPITGIELRIDTAITRAEDASSSEGGAIAGEGEIQARGPSVFSGYHNLPEQTAAAFTADGWFRTGDLGYLDPDGYLYITGRANTLIVLDGGKKIQPEPLEEIYARHRFIQDVGVLKADGRLVAVIVPEMGEVTRWINGDADLAVRTAVTEIGPALPSWQRVTDYVISLDPLPKTNLGKTRRHQLAELYHQITAGQVADTATAIHPMAVEDMSEQDRALLDTPAAREVWNWLAAKYHDRALSPDSSPQLDLGIDSLGWLTLTLELADHTGVELSDAAIQRIDTVRALLYEVSSARPAAQNADNPTADQHAELTSAERALVQAPGPVLQGIVLLLLLLNRALARRLFRLEVRGAEHLPAHGPFVLTPNHRSDMDAFAVAAALPASYLVRTYWAAGADIMYRTPLRRWISRALRVIPITRNTGTGRSSLLFGAMILQQGQNLVWFPEGTVSQTGGLLPFRRGLGLVLDKQPATVVPVYLRGTDDVQPLNSRRLRLRPISVTFGPPVEVQQLAEEGTGDDSAGRIVAALHDRMVALEQAVL